MARSKSLQMLAATLRAVAAARVARAAPPMWPAAVRMASAAASSAAVAPAAGAVPAATAPAAQPYFITEAPTTATAPKRKWGQATILTVRGHTKKLNPVARQVVGLAVNEANVLMAFSHQRRAADMQKAVERAARNADFHHDITSDRLIIDRAWTGKVMSSPRIRHHSKGRAGMSHKRVSRLDITVREMTPEEYAAKRRFVRTPNSPQKVAGLDPRGY